MKDENIIYKVVMVYDLGDCPIMSSYKYFERIEDAEAFMNKTNQRRDCRAYLKTEYRD